uniref:Uncharacterized protein n=1 Tax=Nelumbo nucifera TaxID=4432 RepID=A0A822ZFS9_NELNU|nr:TPA_asm: hypothetical protein HUJ06_002212 [Nelumbo nucifera]
MTAKDLRFGTRLLVMEGDAADTQASSEFQAKAVDVRESDVNPAMASSIKVEGEIVINGGLKHEKKGESKEEEEETALDGGFIKVEKETVDVKDGAHKTEGEATSEEGGSSALDRSSSNLMANRDLLESQEKVKELELELERVVEALKHSESENTHLKEELLLTKGKLDGSVKLCEDLEVNKKRVEEQILQNEERYNLQINTLQEALQAHEEKHKDLINVKEAFDGLTFELENSRKKVQELEQELLLSVGEMKKFEELSKQSDSYAESETKKALEFERLLKLAKVNAQEMEVQMASLQEEVKGLYEKIAENERVEESLRTTAAELSGVQAELEISRAQKLDLEKMLSSKEANINELTKELDLHKTSEAQMKEDILALENLFSSVKGDLQAKNDELEEIKLKLHEEVKSRELVEVDLRSRETQISSVQEELAKVIVEKETLEATVADLNSMVMQTKELCGDLENKLKLSDENFCKSDSLLSQALSSNAELEQKLKSLEELQQESGTLAATATQKNLELEDIIKASNAATEEAKLQLRDTEMRLISAEQKNVELEQQLNLVELKSNNAERELKEYSQKTSELTAILERIEEEKTLLKSHVQEYEGKITQLESFLNQASLRSSDLELELKNVSEKCSEHEDRANTSHQRSIELENLIQTTHSKVEDAGKKVVELESLLQAANHRAEELEEQINTLKVKYNDAELESNQFSSKVSELTAELETFQTKASGLEISLQASDEKERELKEFLNVITEEKRKSDEELISSTKKLAEAENLLEVLQNELKSTQEKLENIEQELRVSGIKENEVLEKLKSAEEQLEQQGKLIEQATTRNTELEALHESLVRDSELKLQEAMVHFTNKDSETKSLYEKLKILEDESKTYEEKAAKETEKSNSLKVELDQSLVKLMALESTIDDLKAKILEVEDRAAQSFSENELLSQTNLQLKTKVNELQEFLNSACDEKEATAQMLASHLNTIAELTDQHSRVSELQSETEFRVKEAERQLQESIERYALKDSEAKDLTEKLTALEIQVRKFEEQAHELSALSETQKAELEGSLLKLKNLESDFEEMRTKASHYEKESEGLAEVNLQLKMKVNELQELLASASDEKEVTAQILASHMNTIAELTDQHSRVSELQSETECRIREAEKQLQESIEQYIQKYSEAKDLNEKLIALEIQVRKLEEQADESCALSEAQKAELEEALLKLKLTESSFEEMKTKATHFEKESEGLAEANLKLTRELEAYESNLKELQTTFSAILTEKDDAVEHLQSSKKYIEDLKQQLSLEGQQLQSQVASVMEENSQLNEKYHSAKKELETERVQLEEHKERESILKVELENLKAHITENFVVQTRVAELEEQLRLAESRQKEEVESVRSMAAEKEEKLVSELQEYAHKLCDKEALHEQVQQLQKELKLSQNIIAEKDEEKQRNLSLFNEELEILKKKSSQDAELEKKIEEERNLAIVNAELDDLKKKHSQTAELEKKIEELENKLKLGNNSSVQGDLRSPAEFKDGLEVKSRDLGSTISTPSKRKSKKKSDAASPQASPSSGGIHPAAPQISSAMSFKFILGVALVSVIIGVILGKRY